MSQATRQIRKIGAGNSIEFDEQAWPVHCAVLVLAGAVGGVIYAVSDFHDPRWLYNGWIHVAALGLAVLVLLLGILWLRDRMLRRLQLGLIVSLLVHLVIALYLHQQHLTMVAMREDRPAEPAREAPPVTMPEYHSEYYEQPTAEQAFQRPVETTVPNAPEATPDHTNDAQQDIPLDHPPVDRAIPRRQQPNPLEMARRELSAPRRTSEEALRPLSRQTRRDVPVPDQPIADPKPVSRSENLDLVFSGSAATAPHTPSDLPLQNRIALDDPGDRDPHSVLQPLRQQPRAEPDSVAPATPTPTRALTDLAPEASTPAAVPAPAPVAQRPQQMESPAGLTSRTETALPQARRQASEPTAAPIPQSDTALADARIVRQQPQPAEVPRAQPSRQAATLDVPLAASEPAPQPSAVTPQLRTVLEPNTSPARRTRAARPAANPDLATAETAAPLASALASNSPMRPQRSETQQPAGQAELPGQVARQSPSALALSTPGMETVAEGQPAAAPANAPSRTLAEPDRAAVARRAARPQGTSPGQPGQAVAADAPAVQVPATQGRRAEGSRQHVTTPATSEGSPSVVARSVPGIGLKATDLAAAEAGVAEPIASGGTPGQQLVAPSSASQQRATSQVLVGQGTPSAGSADAAVDAAELASLSGVRRAGRSDAPVLSGSSEMGPIGRAATSPEVVGGLPGSMAEPIAQADGSSASEGTENLPGPAVSGLAAETPRSAAVGVPGGTAGAAVGEPGDSPSAGALVGGPRLAAVERGQSPSAATAGGEGTVLPRGLGSPSVGEMVSGEIAEAAPEAPAAGTGMPAGGGQSSDASSTEPGWNARPTDMGPTRTVAGLPGSAGDRAPLAGADRMGPVASTPGIAIGPRRPAPGQGQGPSIAAELGSGPMRQSVAPGLPAEASEPGEPVPEAVAMRSEPGLGGDLGSGPNLDAPSRTSGGLPVFNRAEPGPGGLGREPSPSVGILDRRARPESESVHSVSRRFVLDRAGGELAIDGRTHEEPMAAFKNRELGDRETIARERGGTPGTEQAVEMGLDFLARHQFPDGHWSLERLPHGGAGYEDVALGTMQSDTAATGLALLSFLGAGYTHQEDKYRAAVRRALEWLGTNQKADGDLFVGGSQYTWFYSHGIASIALCEAYGMTRDKALRDPAQRAIQFILSAQHPTRGGWRYAPQSESDTSVTGWQLMAMQSARMAGLQVPEGALNQVGHWLDLARVAEGRYMYNPNAGNSAEQRSGREASAAMTAEALLMRMYLGWDRTHPELIQGVEYLRERLPEVGTPKAPTRDSYYWYYATQVMFHMQGDAWEAWNGRLRPLLQNSQVKQGPLAGSWHPQKPIRDRWGEAGGRLYVTAMDLLMLEVYYRHLPLYEELK